tara:strand:+ start:54 stop:317 length:264 start_codon:yes stop_codon:yes gene_type:complete
MEICIDCGCKDNKYNFYNLHYSFVPPLCEKHRETEWIKGNCSKCDVLYKYAFTDILYCDNICLNCLKKRCSEGELIKEIYGNNKEVC